MKIFVIIISTVLIITFSWFLSIKHGRYHGIPRFFAFESVFILLLMNYRYWFIDPFSLNQVLSWMLLFLSVYVVVDGYIRLTREGKPGRNFENTSRLVSSGIYKYIRHPLYLSIFLLGTGIMLKKPELFQFCLGVINLVAVYLTARIEEKEMLAKFGREYDDYREKTKMFIPFVF